METKSLALRRRLMIFTVIFAVLALALAAVRVWLIDARLDPETLFWNRGDPVPVVYTYVTYAVALAAYLLYFLFRNKIDERAPSRTKTAVRIGTMIAGVFSIAAAVMQLTGAAKPSRGGVFFILAGIFLFVSAVYFAVCLFAPKDYSAGRALIGFTVPVAYVMLLLLSYFEISLVTNNPAKISEMLCLILLVFWFLTELRFEVKSSKPALFFAAGWAAMVMIAVSVIPNLYAALFLSRTMTLGLYSQIAELGILIYLVCRLFCACGEADEKPEDEKSSVPEQTK